MNTDILQSGMFEYFQTIKDPRVNRGKYHPVKEILLLTIAGVMCGCETWEDIETFGYAKEKFLKQLLPFKHGIPSDDTLRRFFRVIDYREFQSSFVAWIDSIEIDVTQGVIAIDGKTSKGSRDGAKNVLHMVSAFASEAKLVLAQEKVSDKSNEITAIPKLLDLLDVEGATITIDALGCQRNIAAKIIDKNADYFLAVKGNQENLYHCLINFFESGLAEQALNLDYHETEEMNRGRKEIRRCHASSSPILGDAFSKWQDLKSVIKLESERIVNGKHQRDVRYYISSKILTAQEALDNSREHWSVENSLHWVLDVSFNEDASKIKKDHAPSNLAIIRHIALNILRACKPKRRSLKGYKKDLGWDNDLLCNVLQYMCEHVQVE